MGDREKRKQELKRKSREAAARTDALLDEELALLLRASQVDLDALKPKVADQETYDRLIAAVGEATARNESVAALRERLQQVGAKAAGVARQIAGLLRP